MYSRNEGVFPSTPQSKIEILQELLVALTIGLFGSLHCVGMCGPIAISLPFANPNRYQEVANVLSYNFGRIIGYGVLGVLPGIIGSFAYIAGAQSILCVSMGVLMIVSVLGLHVREFVPASRWLTKIEVKVRTIMSKFLSAGSSKNLLRIGFINAFLPCGMVYIALAGASTQPSIGYSILYMMAFGFGTAPLMILLCLSKQRLSQNIRRKFKNIIPIFICVVGVLFILRGLGIDLPMELSSNY